MSSTITHGDPPTAGRHATPGRASLRSLLRTGRHRRTAPESLGEFAARVAGGLTEENMPVRVITRDGALVAYAPRRTDDTVQMPRIILTASTPL